MGSHFIPRGTRLFAAIVDFFVIYIFQIVGAYAGAFMAATMLSVQKAPDLVLTEGVRTGFWFGWFFWGFVGWFLNYGVLQGTSGATLGKMAFRICVLNQDGSEIGILKSISRTYCYLASCSPFFMGVVAMFWSEQGLCWHDQICSTKVVSRVPLKSIKKPVLISNHEDLAA